MNWETEFVLLAGDYTIIPIRRMVATGEQGHFFDYDDISSPVSDIYYACLDGNYNSNEDPRWGETTDGENGGDVDLRAEVYTGRISVETIDEMNNFVKKTINYDSMDDSIVEKVLLVGADKQWEGDAKWGGNHLDQIIDESNADGYTTQGIPSDIYVIDKLYDRDWPGNSWPVSELINRINSNVHIVCNEGHSNYWTDMKLLLSHAQQFTNDYPFFGYSTACKGGGFDDPMGYDSIVEEFLIKSEYGAFAGIWNTRDGWGGGEYPPFDKIDYGNHRYHREFWDAIFSENIKEIAKANQDSKEDNIWRIDETIMRFAYYSITCFGDPTIVLKVVNENQPDKPQTPDGPASIVQGEQNTYTSSTTDADGDKIYYLWDFGDGNYSGWMGPYESDEICSVNHIWEERGSFEIKVKSKDYWDAESEWSDPLPLTVPRHFNLNVFNKIFNLGNGFLLQLLENILIKLNFSNFI
jgi:hypothetical protein